MSMALPRTRAHRPTNQRPQRRAHQATPIKATIRAITVTMSSDQAAGKDPSSPKTEDAFPSSPRPNWEIIYQGAEAKVWKIPAGGGRDAMVCKERFSKAYRHPMLDERLTKSRCKAEGKALEKCWKSDGKVRAPKLIRIQSPLLFLEFLHGPTVKQFLAKALSTTLSTAAAENPAEDASTDAMSTDPTATAATATLAKLIGMMLGNLHDLGLIHGDLTTSNMIVLDSKPSDAAPSTTEENGVRQMIQESDTIALIDFGLAKSTTSAEEQAVDLYVLERALLSAHPELDGAFFAQILDVYKTTRGQSKFATNALTRLEQVRQRGRKRECFG